MTGIDYSLPELPVPGTIVKTKRVIRPAMVVTDEEGTETKVPAKTETWSYRVLDKPAFCGRKPYAVIVGGSNDGVEVILV